MNRASFDLVGGLATLAFPLLLTLGPAAWGPWVVISVVAMLVGPLSTFITFLAWQAGRAQASTVAWRALATVLWSLPLTIVMPGAPVVWFAMLAAAVWTGSRGDAVSWRDLPELAAARAARDRLRAPTPGRRSWTLATAWGAWWWTAFVVAGVWAFVGLFAAASAVGGMGSATMGSSLGAIALGMVGGLLAIPIAAAAATLAVPVTMLGVAVGISLPACRYAFLVHRFPRGQRGKALLGQLVLDLAVVASLVAIPTLWDLSGALVAVDAALLLTLLLARALFGAALEVRPSARAAARLVARVAVRPASLIRAALVQSLMVAVTTLLGWFSLCAALALTCPLWAFAAVVHLLLAAAGATGSTHLAVAGLETLLTLGTASVLAGMPLHRLTAAHADYWPTYLAGVAR